MSQLKHSNSEKLTSQPFGELSNGQQTRLYTLTNINGLQASICDYGALLVSLFTPDKTGRMADIVLGYDRASDYENDGYYLGAVVGRYAGRIDQGIANINGNEVQLALNAPDSQLHGGTNAFNKRLWQLDESSTRNKLTLVLFSEDGDNGYPGNLQVKVSYQLTDNNELIVEYHANTDKDTLLNLTHHSYFNLAGHNAGDIHNHQIQIQADNFLPMNERAYPTGEIKAVKGTAHDFSELKRLGDEIDGDDPQINIGLGYDNYWLVNEEYLSAEVPAAQAVDPDSGRRLTLYTDQPSMILYTANYIDGSHVGKNNFTYQKRAAFCLEPQRANNKTTGVSLNNALLTPEQTFYSKNIYQFDVL